MHAILSWPLAHDWIFGALWITGVICAGIAGLCARLACSRTRAAAWMVVALAAFSVGIMFARTDVGDWSDLVRRWAPAPLPVGAPVRKPERLGPKAEGLDYLARILSDPSYTAKEKRKEWETVLPALGASDQEIAAMLGTLRTHSARPWDGVSLDLAMLWMDISRDRLAAISPANELSPGIARASIRSDEGRMSILVVVNDGVVSVPPSVLSGTVLRSIEWRSPLQDWQPWPCESPLPAKGSGFEPLWMQFAPGGTFEYRITGDAVLYNEEYPMLLARKSFQLTETFPSSNTTK